MAVRFVKPIKTPYESQFVPMPLEAMYKSLQEKQKGLDTTEGLIASSSLNLDGAIWDVEQGNVSKIKEKYLADVDKLAKKLAENKGNYAAIATELTDVNKKYQNYPEVQRILKHKELFDANIADAMAKEDSSSLYYRNLVNIDPDTQQQVFKPGPQIKLQDIVAPIPDNTTEYIWNSFVKNFEESITQLTGKPYTIKKDPSTGFFVVTDNTGAKTDLNLDNKFVVDAIKSSAKILLQEESDQAHYIKEFLPNKKTGKRGINTIEDLEDYVEEIAKLKFYTKEQPKLNFIAPASPRGGGSRGGGGGGDLIEDFQLTLTNIPQKVSDPSTFVALNNTKNGIITTQTGLIDKFQTTSINAIGEVDAIAGTNFKDEIANIYKTTGSTVDAAIQAANKILSVYSNLPSIDQDKLKGTLTSLKTDLDEIALLEQKKTLYNGVSTYISEKVANVSLSSKDLEEFKNAVVPGAYIGDVNVNPMSPVASPYKLTKELTDAEKTELASLIALRKNADSWLAGTAKGWFGMDSKYKKADIDKRIQEITGAPGTVEFEAGGILGADPNPFDKLLTKVDETKVDDLLADGIKIDLVGMKYTPIGEKDTEVEKIIAGWEDTLKDTPISGIASMAGFKNEEEFFNAAVFNSEGINSYKDLSFSGATLVDNPNQGIPTVLYSFAKSSGGQAVVQILAPLITKTNKQDFKTIALETYLDYPRGDKAVAAGRLYATAGLSEIDYTKLLFLTTVKGDPNTTFTYNFLDDPNLTITKKGDIFTINIPGATPGSTKKPGELFSILGLYMLADDTRGL